MRILLVEDDSLLGDGIQKSLSHLGFTVDWMRDGKQGEHALTSEEYAAVVLDRPAATGRPDTVAIREEQGAAYPRPDPDRPR